MNSSSFLSTTITSPSAFLSYINPYDPADIARHDRMVALVTQMLDLNKKLQDARLEQERTMLSQQIEATKTALPFPLTVLPIQPPSVLPPNRCYLRSFSAAIQPWTAKWAIEWSIPKTIVSFFHELVSFWELGTQSDKKSPTEKWVYRKVCFP